jgi:hypothetical protein
MESSAMEDRGDHPRPEAIAKVLCNSSRKLRKLRTALLDLRFFPLSLLLSLAFQSSILLRREKVQARKPGELTPKGAQQEESSKPKDQSQVRDLFQEDGRKPLRPLLETLLYPRTQATDQDRSFPRELIPKVHRQWTRA